MDALEVVQRYLSFWFAQDIDSMEPMLSDDLLLWHNHIGKEFGKADMLDFIRGSLDVIARIEFRNPRWTVLNDNKVLLQHEMYVETRDAQILRDIPNAIVYTLKDGQIAVIEEYVDGQAFAPLGLA